MSNKKGYRILAKPIDDYCNTQIVTDYLNYCKKHPLKFINYSCEINNLKLYWWQKLYLIILLYFNKLKFKIIKY